MVWGLCRQWCHDDGNDGKMTCQCHHQYPLSATIIISIMTVSAPSQHWTQRFYFSCKSASTSIRPRLSSPNMLMIFCNPLISFNSSTFLTRFPPWTRLKAKMAWWPRKGWKMRSAKQRNQLVHTVRPMIDQPNKKCAFCSQSRSSQIQLLLLPPTLPTQNQSHYTQSLGSYSLLRENSFLGTIQGFIRNTVVEYCLTWLCVWVCKRYSVVKTWDWLHQSCVHNEHHLSCYSTTSTFTTPRGRFQRNSLSNYILLK